MSSCGIRVLILDLGSVSRNQLVKQLEDHPHISVVGQAAHRRQAMRLLQQLGPDLLILTLETSTADNVEIVETIMATSAIPILVMHFGGENAGDEDYIFAGRWRCCTITTTLHSPPGRCIDRWNCWWA